MKKILLLLCLTVLACNSDDKESGDPIYVAENGVTIKAQPWTEVGDTWTIDGKTYIVADRAMLAEALWNKEDMSIYVTSKITILTPRCCGEESWERPIWPQSGHHVKLKNWDVSNVTDISYLFARNQDDSFTVDDLSYWDTGNVTRMEGTFFKTPIEDQNLNNWDVSKVTNMKRMFAEGSFNGQIGNWDVSSVTNMERMFYRSDFNQPIGDWDVSNVTNVLDMFRGAAFNQPIGNWDVSNLRSMKSMFRGSAYNQPLNNWDVSSCEVFEYMFLNSTFNQPIGNWDVSNVKNMQQMFMGNQSFNQDLGSWDTRNVRNMVEMFAYCTNMNQDLGGWNVDNVINDRDFCRGVINWTLPKPPLSAGAGWCGFAP